MKTKDILKGVVDGIEGVEFLNGMQEAMASDQGGRVMLIAPTGSGKTIAFVIRLLRNVDEGVQGVKGVIVAPTRELVLQIAGVVGRIAGGLDRRTGEGNLDRRTGGAGGFVDGDLERRTGGDCRTSLTGRTFRTGGSGQLRVVALYGGHAMEDEKRSVAVTPDIVVATPGRLVDHMRRGTIDVSGVRSLVLDEFDKSLQLGFQDQMRRIVKGMRRLSLVVLTSATRMGELPEFVGCEGDFKVYDYSEREGAGPQAVRRIVGVRSAEKDKLPALVELLGRIGGCGRVIVFVNYRESAERVHERLVREGVPAGLYHGALDQQQRRIAVEKLANGTTPVLVATDLASRGLDIPGVEAVVHYHLPVDGETWTHRNGRTARQGADGMVFVILGPGEVPTGEFLGEVSDRRTGGTGEMLEGLESWEDFVRSGDFCGDSCAGLKRMGSLYINAGKREKISKGDVAGYVMKQGGLDREDVGRIMVDDHYAVVAVAADKVKGVIDRLRGVKIKGVRVKVSEV